VNQKGLSLLEVLVAAVGVALLVGLAAGLQFQAQRRFTGIESSLVSIGDLRSIQRRLDQDVSHSTGWIEFPSNQQLILRGRAVEANGDLFDSTVRWAIENDAGPQCRPGQPCVRLVRRQTLQAPGVVPFDAAVVTYPGLIAARWCSEFGNGAGVPPMAGCLDFVRPAGSRKVLYVQLDYLDNLGSRRPFPMALALRNVSFCTTPSLVMPLLLDEVRR
jgi:hypothetical protein